jgi:hypothetical protein
MLMASPNPTRKPKPTQNASQIEEIIASHHGRKRVLPNSCVVITKARRGLKHAKNLGSKNGYLKTTTGKFYQKAEKIDLSVQPDRGAKLPETCKG